MGYRGAPPWVYKEEATIREASLEASHRREVSVLRKEIEELKKEVARLKEENKKCKDRVRELETELKYQKGIKAVRAYRPSKTRRKKKLPKEMDII